MRHSSRETPQIRRGLRNEPKVSCDSGGLNWEGVENNGNKNKMGTYQISLICWQIFCWMTWNTSANLGTKALKIEDYFEQHWSPANSIEAVPHWPLCHGSFPWNPYYKWAISEVSKHLPMHKSSHWASMQYSRLPFVNCQGYCRSLWVPGWRFPRTHLKKSCQMLGEMHANCSKIFLVAKVPSTAFGSWRNMGK